MLLSAIPAESELVVRDIMAQADEYMSIPPRKLHDGTDADQTHGFLEWLAGLQAGYSTLPDKIPDALLRAWRDGYANRRALCRKCFFELPLAANGCVDLQAVCGGCGKRDFDRATPVAIFSCASCLLALPNAVPGDAIGCLEACPACGGADIR